jgi:hypothetical protein
MWRSPYHIEPLREDRNYIRPRVLEPRGSLSARGPWRRASEVCQFFCVNDQVLFLGWAQGKGKVKLEVLGRVSEEGSCKTLTLLRPEHQWGWPSPALLPCSPVTT